MSRKGTMGPSEDSECATIQQPIPPRGIINVRRQLEPTTSSQVAIRAAQDRARDNHRWISRAAGRRVELASSCTIDCASFCSSVSPKEINSGALRQRTGMAGSRSRLTFRGRRSRLNG